jgi:hypothetical protein
VFAQNFAHKRDTPTVARRCRSPLPQSSVARQEQGEGIDELRFRTQGIAAFLEYSMRVKQTAGKIGIAQRPSRQPWSGRLAIHDQWMMQMAQNLTNVEEPFRQKNLGPFQLAR